jgi:uncharacterized protein
MGATAAEGRPASQPARIDILDVLRGFALSGMLAVNVSYHLAPAQTPAGHAAHTMVELLADGCFYPIFAFLFGVGFAMQLARGRGFLARRLGVLLVIGLADAVFLWWGDILVLYALLGFPLLLLRRASDRVLTASLAVALIASAVPWPRHDFEGGGDALERAYRSGSYLEAVAARMEFLPPFWASQDQLPAHVFALFLLGLISHRRGLFAHGAPARPIVRRVLVCGLILAVSGGAAVALGVKPPLRDAVKAIARPAMAAVYCSGLALLYARRPTWVGWMRYAGRMALTNYLLQSLVLATVFYAYGFGQFRKMEPAAALALALAVFLAQTALSAWWLKRFRIGPAEWVWRRFT